MIEKNAPDGSAITLNRPTWGMSVGGTFTVPPFFAALAAEASQSEAAK